MFDEPLYYGIYISIHASRGGSDTFSPSSVLLSDAFQSTLPVGEATIVVLH